MKFKRNPQTDFVDAIQIPVKMTLCYENGKQCCVCSDDWLVVDITNNVRIYKKEVFEKAFIKVE